MAGEMRWRKTRMIQSEEIGWSPPPRLLRAMGDLGFTEPWQMSYEEFTVMHDRLTLWEGRTELDRIARALTRGEGSDLPTAMKYYGRDFAYGCPTLVRTMASVTTDEIISIWRAVGKNDPNPIRPGDWVALEKWYAKQHGSSGFGDAGGSRLLHALVQAGDVAWAGTSCDEWLYAPAEFQDLDYRGLRSVHRYLVLRAANAGLLVPAEIIAEYA